MNREEKRKRGEQILRRLHGKNGEEESKPFQLPDFDTRKVDPKVRVARNPDFVARGLHPNAAKCEKARKKAERMGGASPTARLAEALLKRIRDRYKAEGIIVKNKDWHLYRAGKWEVIEDGREPLEPLAMAVQEVNNTNPRRANDILDFIEKRSRLPLDEKFYGCMREDESRTQYLINCPSKVLIIDSASGEIVGALEHSPEFKFTTSLGVEYDETAKCTLFLKTLDEVQEDPLDRELLLDWCATILLPHSKFEVALCCVGDGSNGKSIIMEAIANAIGWENVTTITLNQICAGDRKQMHRLRFAALNLSTETDIKRIFETSIFKKIVSGERFTTERIFREGFDMQTNCKICPLANNIPVIAGGTYADSRRFEFLHWPKIYEGDARNLELKDKLKGEAAGILGLLVKRLPKVCAMKSLGHGGENSQVIRKLFVLSNNPVKAFVDDYLVSGLTSDKFLTKDDIWKAYRRFCVEQDIEPGYRKDFFMHLYKYKAKCLVASRKRINGYLQYIIRKVGFNLKGRTLMKS